MTLSLHTASRVTARRGAASAALAIALALAAPARAAEPLGVSHRGVQPDSVVPVFQTPAIDLAAALARADAKRPSDVPAPLEYAIPFEVNLTPSNSGTWEVVDLGRKGRFWLWRLQIESPAAKSVNLGFTRFQLPPGASLSVYSPDYRAGGSP